MIIHFKYVQVLKNIILVALKYATIIGVLSFLLFALNLLILVTPQHSNLILSLLIVVCLAAGYFYANQKTRQYSKSEPADHLNPYKVLSNREIEVFQELLTGKTNKEISTQLFIEISTLKSHINRIYKKLDVKTRTELRQNFLK